MTRAVLDGPLTFDSAISREAQTTKQFAVPVASDADTHPISKPAIRSPRRSTLGRRVLMVLTSLGDPLRAGMAR
jgi:hypothetical protein